MSPWLYSTHSFFISACAEPAANANAAAATAASIRIVMRASLGLIFIGESWRGGEAKSSGMVGFCWYTRGAVASVLRRSRDGGIGDPHRGRPNADRCD